MIVTKKYYDVHGVLREKKVPQNKLKLNWLTFTKDSSYSINFLRLKKVLNYIHVNRRPQSQDDIVVCFSHTQLKDSFLNITDMRKVVLRLGAPREFSPDWWFNKKNDTISVGWFYGTDNWAYKVVAQAIVPNLSYSYKYNQDLSVTVLSNPQSTNTFKNLSNKIVRLDALRSYNKNGFLSGKITDGGNVWKENLSKCGAIVATNKELYNFAKTVNNNVFFITNGLDLNEFKYIYKIVPKKEFIVGFVGSIIKPEYRSHKGYDLAVKACEQENVVLREALYKQKQIPHEQMINKFYSQIDCLVHPTLSEGCSNVVMECLALGIPVITTKTCGFHGETLTDRENVLFCERSTESISKCILELKNDCFLRLKLSQNGRLFAEEHHDIIKIAKQWDEVINVIISNKWKI